MVRFPINIGMPGPNRKEVGYLWEYYRRPYR